MINNSVLLYCVVEIKPVRGGFDPLEDEAVTHLWGDHGSGLKQERLNEKQMEALEMAVDHRFSLIQGPPG